MHSVSYASRGASVVARDCGHRGNGLLRFLGMLLSVGVFVGAGAVTGMHVRATSFPSLGVFVGYADNFHSSGFFPTPWYGGSGVVFQGCSPPTSCSYDGGVAELVNSSGAPVTINSVSVQLNAPGDTVPCVVNIWPSNVSLAAGQTLIDAQTASGASSGCPAGGEFDTSDVGPNGTNWVGQCGNSGVIPQVTVTANGVAQTFTDSQQVLNTGGVDLNTCPSGTNESEPYTHIGGNPIPPGFMGGSHNGLASQIPTCNAGQPVNCASGNLWETFPELNIPGRGIPLSFSLTYNSLQAAQAGPLGFGWSSNLNVGLTVNQSAGTATVSEDNGSTVLFTANGSGSWTAPAAAPVSLTQDGDGTFTLLDKHRQQQEVFSSTGQVQKLIDRNGYTTTFTYQNGRLTTVTDPAGRTLTVTFGSNGDISSVNDATGRTVSLGYDGGGNLAAITDMNNGQTTFTYDRNHLLLTRTDPRNGVVTNTYDSSGRALTQVDAMQRKTTWSYLAGTTTITDPNGNITREHFSSGVPVAVERGVGTAADATWKYTYDPNVLAVTNTTDPNGHTTTQTYDASANLLSTTDPLNHTTTYTYDSLNDLATVTDPALVTTTNTHDGRGNLTATSRPLTGTGQSQTSTLTYGDATHPGDVTVITDADGKTWSFTYDSSGDLASSADPLNDTTTYGYDPVGRRTSMVSPLGNVSGGNPAAHTTVYTFDNFGNLLSTTDPLSHVSSATYDADRNVATTIDADHNITTNAYDLDNELTQVTRADNTVVHTGYDGDGNVTSQTDGANNATTYSFDSLNRVASSTDPLTRTTTYGYDLAGNQTSLKDPSSQTTTYGYDAANELVGITYSDGKTPNVTLTYTVDGQRNSMTDGTGSSTYHYDSLNRLTSLTNGANQSDAYGYDLKGQLTQLQYPNGQTVTRGFDGDGRLTSVSDWLTHTTTFTYDADGNLTSNAYPNTTTATLGYNAADQLLSISDAPNSSPTTPFASFSYTRDPVGQLASIAPTGVSQGNETYGYTKLNQLSGVNSGTYSYSAADNLTKLTSGATLGYDAANEVTSLSSNPSATFSYDSRGNRLAGEAPGGSATYAYDQANRLSSYTGPGGNASLATGGSHTLAVRSDGTVWSWGNNQYGELGNNTTTNSLVPVQVSGLSGVTSVAAGEFHSVALKADGTAWDWGYNGHGQLGDGTTTNKIVPEQVLTGAVAIAAGADHTLALKADGTVWAWEAMTSTASWATTRRPTAPSRCRCTA